MYFAFFAKSLSITGIDLILNKVTWGLPCVISKFDCLDKKVLVLPYIHRVEATVRNKKGIHPTHQSNLDNDYIY